MNIIKFSLQKPLIIFLCVALIIILGVFSLSRLPSRKLPYIAATTFTIETLMPGASAKEVDHSIAKIISQEFNDLPYLDHIKSYSRPGISLIYIMIKPGADTRHTYQQITKVINKVRKKLPSHVKRPLIHEYSMHSQPIFWVLIRGEKHSLIEVTQLIKSLIKPALQEVSGVAAIEDFGQHSPIVQVALNPVKMSAYGINLQKVILAFNNENFSLPGYYVSNKNNQYLLNMNLHFQSLNELENLIVTSRKGNLIRLAQIAEVNYASKPGAGYVNLNESRSVALAIMAQSTAKDVVLIKKIKETLKKKIIPNLPSGYRIDYFGDLTNQIKAEVDGLTSAIFFSIVFACLIVLFFLRSFSASFIVLFSVFISLSVAIIFLNIFGKTINIVTLSGLILLVGICVDDVIVVVENNFKLRLRHPGDPSKAAFEGTSQVLFPVLTATTSLIVIFSSLVAMKGLVRIFFTPFAVIIVSGVIASFVSSFTVTPILCCHFLRSPATKNRVYIFLSRLILRIKKGYFYLLKKLIWQPWVIVVIIIIIFLPAKNILSHMGSSFLPAHVNYNNLIVNVHTGPNSNQSYTNNKIRTLIKIIKNNQQVKNVFAVSNKYSSTDATIYIELKRTSKPVNTSEDLQDLTNVISLIPGIKFSIRAVPLNKFFAKPFDFIIVGKNFKSLHADALKLEKALVKHPELGRFSPRTSVHQTQYKLDVNRALVNKLGISSKLVAEMISLFGGNINVGKITKEGYSYDILLQPTNNSLNNPHDISKTYLFSPDGIKVPLSSLAKLIPIAEPSTFVRYNFKYTFLFSSTPTITTTKAIVLVKKISKKILAPTNRLIISGESKRGAKALNNFYQAGLLALILLYILLSLQFNSLSQPLILLTAQPLGIVGALYGLWAFGMSINLYSLVGLLLLIGLLTKNTILLVNMINEMRAQGHNIKVSIARACPRRFIPLIMTSLTIILAMLPVFFITSGSGSRNQQVLAVTVISGMLSSTILSLFVVPGLYLLPSYAAQLVNKLRGKKT